MKLISFLNSSAFFLALLAGNACQSQPGTNISGVIETDEAWKKVVYLIEPRNWTEIAASYSGVVLDSAVVGEDGKFSFQDVSGIKAGKLYELVVQEKGSRFANKLSGDYDPAQANYMPVFLQQGSEIRCTASINHFQTSFRFAKPDLENTLLRQICDIRAAAFAPEQTWLSSDATIDESTLLAKEDALLRFRTPLMNFADTTTSFWPALLVTRWVSPDNDYERIPEFITRQCKKWQNTAENTAFVAQLCEKADGTQLPVMVGDRIADFPLPTQEGDTVLLSTLLTGKSLIILDIWASWCGPCRHENRDVLVPLWQKHKQNGLQIIGYSIDASAGAWKGAVQKDGAVWPQTSHLVGDATPFMDELRITTIPANFILDNQGKVLAKNLHGAALQEYVDVYFSGHK